MSRPARDIWQCVLYDAAEVVIDRRFLMQHHPYAVPYASMI